MQADGSELPKTPLLGSQPEIENALRIDCPDRVTMDVSGDEAVSDFFCGVLRNAQDVPEARKTGKPEIERKLVRLRYGFQIDECAHPRVFQQHHQRADDTAHADVARSTTEALLGQRRQDLKIVAKLMSRSVSTGVPERVVVKQFASQIYSDQQSISRLGIECGQQPIRPAENRDSQIRSLAAVGRMSADDGYAVGLRGCEHPGPDFFGFSF